MRARSYDLRAQGVWIVAVALCACSGESTESPRQRADQGRAPGQDMVAVSDRGLPDPVEDMPTAVTPHQDMATRGDDGRPDQGDAEDLAPDIAPDMPDQGVAPCTGECTYTLPNCDLDDVRRNPGNNWSDSYSVDGKCYCDTTFDHNVGTIMVDVPGVGMKSVREICEAIGPGPGRGNNPVYNDVQCGNGPANDAGDEDWCPGRVDQGRAGCCTAGPRWDLDGANWSN